MDKEDILSPELGIALNKWVEKRLENIGIYRENISDEDLPDYKSWKKKIIEDLRRVYSEKAIEIFILGKDNRILDEPDAFARLKGPCGDTVEIYLVLQQNRIADSSFQTDGCESSIAACGMLTEMLKGIELSAASGIDQEDVLSSLGGLPQESEHCALLTVNAPQ